MSSKQSWSSVCYGNGKFVAVALNSDVFAYSTNGTSWTQGSMCSNGTWESVCYGNGKFVAVARGSNKFNYSSDGITWIESTMPSSQNWIPLCYGNNKFVVIGYYTSISLSLSFSTLYYQFSGWNKSDFNITADTSVGGSWSQVSSGGGLILVN